MKILIAPSILSADFGAINKEIKTVEPHCDLIHIDVMDGHFVPNITFGAPVLRKMKSRLPMDVHLMIENPQNFFEDFKEALLQAHGRADDCRLIIHQETCPNLKKVLQKIKKLGMKPAVSINPKTPLKKIESVLKYVDLALLMTVNPGFGGQEFIESVLPKIKQLRKKSPKLHIAVDGGINDETAKKAVAAGADILVAGSCIFKQKNRKKAIDGLRCVS